MPANRFLCTSTRVHHSQYPDPFTGEYNPRAERMTPEDVYAYLMHAKTQPDRYTGYDVLNDQICGIEIVEKVPQTDELRVLRILGITTQDFWID